MGWYFARQLPERMDNTLDRLYRRGSLSLTEEALEMIKATIRKRTRRWSYRGGLLGAISVLMMWLTVMSYWGKILAKWELTSIATLGGFLAGWYIGDAMSYGTISRILKPHGLQLQVQAGHPDGVGGLKPLGDFYGFQAVLTALPAIFIFIWLWLIPDWPGLSYYHWENTYSLLFALALLLEFFTFFLPMRFVHQEMRRQKVLYLPHADALGQRLSQLHMKCATSAELEHQSSFTDQISWMAPVYRSLEYIPTWPIDKEWRRRLVVWSVAVCCGLLIGIPVLEMIVEKFDTPPPPPPPLERELEDQLSPPDFKEEVPADYNWTISTLDGQEFQMTELQGKVMFLNFWATWCPPCVAEMPGIQRLYDIFKDKNVAFVCISREDPDTVREFVEEHEYSFPIYTMDDERPEAFMSRGIPATFILDQDGDIVFRQEGSAKWDDQSSIDFMNGLLNQDDELNQADDVIEF